MPNYKLGTEEYISLSNYKAPFRPAKDGYGADGVQEMHKNDISKAERMLGFKAEYNFRQGLEDMLK